MTVRLKLHAFVSANAWHSVRIVIADVDDGIRDAAVVIEEDSVQTVDPSD
jgi:hypothetical protein